MNSELGDTDHRVDRAHEQPHKILGRIFGRVHRTGHPHPIARAPVAGGPGGRAISTGVVAESNQPARDLRPRKLEASAGGRAWSHLRWSLFGKRQFMPSVTGPAAGSAGSFRGRTVVFLHAHPDDEAIFTAATMHQLAAAGARVVLVTATAGELGPVLRPLRRGESLADRRRVELEKACEVLGVDRLVLLGHRDSGMHGWDDNAHPGALAGADVAVVGRRLADLCAAEGAEALVHYDSDGIYRHPDHVAVHRIGEIAAACAQIPAYEATVDRDHLGGRGRHLVEEAAAGDSDVGRKAVGITTRVAASFADLNAKRAAMAAHASQIPPAALRRRGFAHTYGVEWYIRTGPISVLDALSAEVPVLYESPCAAA